MWPNDGSLVILNFVVFLLAMFCLYNFITIVEPNDFWGAFFWLLGFIVCENWGHTIEKHTD